MTASDRLRRKIDLAFPAFGASTQRIWTSPRIAEVYPDYLCTLHGVTRASVPVMEAARQQAELLAPDDPVAAGVASYLEHHIPEERGHDDWVLEDLEALGVGAERALRPLPSPNVAELIGSQYYWLRHYHPVTLLGHMTVMEGYPPSPEFVASLMERTGYPRDAFRALRRHSYIDLEHRADLYATIDGLPLEPWHETALGVSALHTVGGLMSVFDELAQAAEQPVGTAS